MQHGSVTSACGGHIYTASGTRSGSRRKTFILSDVADPFKAGLADPAQWATYYHIYDNDVGGKTVQYWSFYAFNTGVKVGPLKVGTNLRRERQLEGISAAKARGIYKGRKPSIDVREVLRLRNEERLGPAAIARRLGIGRASVYRVLGKHVTAVNANEGANADQA